MPCGRNIQYTLDRYHNIPLNIFPEFSLKEMSPRYCVAYELWYKDYNMNDENYGENYYVYIKRISFNIIYRVKVRKKRVLTGTTDVIMIDMALP